jgi:poly-beta-1,6-N-acetyl-D-glucosamine synthase
MYWLLSILIIPYLVIMFRNWISLQKIKNSELPSDTSVYVSIIVPCRNEEKRLPFLLDDLAKQDYPPESYEIIVVDDNSTDKTFDTASAFSGIRNFSIVKNSGSGKKSAIRTGINSARGLIIITTDADCRMKERWIKTIASFFNTHKPEMLICPVQLESRSGFFGRFQELEFLSLQGITAGCANAENATMCNGANLAFTKQAYLSHMDNLRNHIPSGDDIFFLHSLKKDPESKILWLESTDALVTASSSTSLREFVNQRKRWISKGSAYDDTFTILLAILTFLTNLLILCLLAASFISILYLKVLLIVVLAKALPDFLILLNTSARYRRNGLMNWFVPAEIVYPFYVLGVAILSFLPFRGKSLSSPFQKGI